jgi:hypothetical protein
MADAPKAATAASSAQVLSDQCKAQAAGRTTAGLQAAAARQACEDVTRRGAFARPAAGCP